MAWNKNTILNIFQFSILCICQNILKTTVSEISFNYKEHFRIYKRFINLFLLLEVDIFLTVMKERLWFLALLKRRTLFSKINKFKASLWLFLLYTDWRRWELPWEPCPELWSFWTLRSAAHNHGHFGRWPQYHYPQGSVPPPPHPIISTWSSLV